MGSFMDYTQEFFDLREFLIMLFKKSRLFIVLAVICGIIGAGAGFFLEGDPQYTSTASASVNTTGLTTDATALTSIMASVKETISGDFFYTGILAAIREAMDEGEFIAIFGEKTQPSIANLKKIIRLYVNGNLVLVDVTSKNESLSTEAANVARGFVIERLSANINNIEITNQGVLTVDKALQAGDTLRIRVVKLGVFGGVGGIVVGVLWVFLVDAMSLKVKKAEDLKKFHLARYELSRQGVVTLLSFLKSGHGMANKGNLLIGITSSNQESGIERVALGLGEHVNGFASGVSVVQISEDTETKTLRSYCEELREKTGVTLLTLPILPESEAGVIAASCCDFVLIVERLGVSRTDEIEQVLQTLGGLGDKASGFMLV